ncbi:MAG: lytic murein transglycosylase [Janthinobacterium lividum]
MHLFAPRPSHARLSAALILAATLSVACTTPPARDPAPEITAGPSSPPSDVHDEAFAAWVGAFRTRAEAAGIGDATLARSLDNVRFLPRVIELDGTQPEFTRTVWDYLDRTVTPQRVTKGREMLQRLRTGAPDVFKPYGVPPETVVAIWGMESNYGTNTGDTPTLDALTTLGFEGRRSGWAQEQLIAALRIVERGDIAPQQMIGSWAGAMGQTQFLPTSFLAYAVDADGDGRRDIWGSLADVAASTANFLAKSGWRAQEPWGFEVRLPAGFDFGRADTSVSQSSAQWSAQGLTSPDGAPLPPVADAYLLLPAGARGPAFMVGANFRAILRYNNSTSYALAVGMLSQRIAGGADVSAPWPRDLAALSRSDTAELQRALSASGFDSGEPDGVAGPATRAAVRAYQRSAGLPADGFAGSELLARLRRLP